MNKGNLHYENKEGAIIMKKKYLPCACLFFLLSLFILFVGVEAYQVNDTILSVYLSQETEVETETEEKKAR